MALTVMEQLLTMQIDGALVTRNEFEQPLTVATTTITSSTAYLGAIALTVITPNASTLLSVRDRQGTPVVLINNLNTSVGDDVPQFITFPVPIKMTSGIDIFLSNTSSTINAWAEYWQ